MKNKDHAPHDRADWRQHQAELPADSVTIRAKKEGHNKAGNVHAKVHVHHPLCSGGLHFLLLEIGTCVGFDRTLPCGWSWRGRAGHPGSCHVCAIALCCEVITPNTTSCVPCRCDIVQSQVLPYPAVEVLLGKRGEGDPCCEIQSQHGFDDYRAELPDGPGGYDLVLACKVCHMLLFLHAARCCSSVESWNIIVND